MAKKKTGSGGSSQERSARVTFLAHELMKHKRLYYAGTPTISDKEYDTIERELAALAPSHPALAFVGTDAISVARKVSHDRPMLSLDKTYDLLELESWVDGRPVVGMWKIDGNSLSLIYKDGELQLAKTRGNGLVGEDVSDKARWVSDIPHHLRSKLSVEIRGELVCFKDSFLELAKEMTARGLEEPTNPRNIVAGFMGRKTQFDLARYFNFYAFDVEDFTDSRLFKKEWDRVQWLEGNGFHLPGAKRIESAGDLQAYLEEVRGLIDEGDVGLDGAVFTYDDVALQHELGSTSHHPRYKISYKWQGNTAHAVIERIDWATSRLGIVTPVAVIQPTFLSGATITNVTLHNAGLVRVHNLKVHDVIEIVRSGEVIPKFLSVLDATKGLYHLPKKCPSCDTTLEFDDVRLKCPNTASCPAQISGVILNWIVNAEIEDLSDKRLQQMLDLGLIKGVADLYRLTEDDLLRLPQTKEKMASKLFANIEKSRNLPLTRFLSGLGVEGAGRTTWEKLIEVFGDLKGLMAASIDDIQGVEGFAEKSAQQIVLGLSQKRNLIKELLDVGVEPKVERRRDSSGPQPLKGKQIVITGTLSRPRAEIENAIRDAGGSPGSAVSKNTFAVVTEDSSSTSSKMKKARELSIPVWNEEALWDYIKSGS